MNYGERGGSVQFNFNFEFLEVQFGIYTKINQFVECFRHCENACGKLCNCQFRSSTLENVLCFGTIVDLRYATLMNVSGSGVVGISVIVDSGECFKFWHH